MHNNIRFIYKLKDLLNILSFAPILTLDNIHQMLQDNYEIEYSLFILFYTFKKLKWTKKWI